MSPANVGVEAQADWTTVESPETYLGAQQGHNFASPGGATINDPHTYTLPETLRLNSWALSGKWTVESRASVLDEAGGAIAFRFHGRDVNLVLRSRNWRSRAVQCQVDGAAPGASHGVDVDNAGSGVLFNRGCISS